MLNCRNNINGKNCISNYILECPTGYFGDCSRQCIPPYYGEDCQSECSCTDGYYCHFALGCLKIKGNDVAIQQSSMINLFIYQSSGSSYDIHLCNEMKLNVLILLLLEKNRNLRHRLKCIDC